MELEFIATSKYDINQLSDSVLFYDKFLFEEKDGNLSMACFFIDSIEQFYMLIQFLFKDNDNYQELFRNKNLIIYNLSDIKSQIINAKYLESFYQHWIEISGRDNNMDEYGYLADLIEYIWRKKDETYLLVRLKILHTK